MCKVSIVLLFYRIRLPLLTQVGTFPDGLNCSRFSVKNIRQSQGGNWLIYIDHYYLLCSYFPTQINIHVYINNIHVEFMSFIIVITSFEISKNTDKIWIKITTADTACRRQFQR